jgi:hypothetical protein
LAYLATAASALAHPSSCSGHPVTRICLRETCHYCALDASAGMCYFQAAGMDRSYEGSSCYVVALRRGALLQGRIPRVVVLLLAHGVVMGCSFFSSCLPASASTLVHSYRCHYAPERCRYVRRSASVVVCSLLQLLRGPCTCIVSACWFKRSSVGSRNRSMSFWRIPRVSRVVGPSSLRAFQCRAFSCLTLALHAAQVAACT